MRERRHYFCHVFLLLPNVHDGFPQLTAGWALRQWLKHPRNLTSKCVTGCQCLYTWRRLVERIRITGRTRDSLSCVRAGTHALALPRKEKTRVF